MNCFLLLDEIRYDTMFIFWLILERSNINIGTVLTGLNASPYSPFQKSPHCHVTEGADFKNSSRTWHVEVLTVLQIETSAYLLLMQQ